MEVFTMLIKIEDIPLLEKAIAFSPFNGISIVKKSSNKYDGYQRVYIEYPESNIALVFLLGEYYAGIKVAAKATV